MHKDTLATYQFIAKRIKQLREEKDVPQKVLAAEIGKSVVAVSNYEKCKRQIPVADLIKIAGVLGEPPATFLSSSSSSSSSNKLLIGIKEIIDDIEDDFEELKLTSFCKMLSEKIVLKLNLQFFGLFQAHNLNNNKQKKQIYRLSPLSYTTDVKLKNKLKSLIQIFANNFSLDLNVSPQNIKAFKSEGLFIIKTISGMRNFIKTYIPKLEILSPVFLEVFGKTSWALVPQIKSNKFEGLLLFNYNRLYTPRLEEIPVYLLLKTYIWKCMNYFQIQTNQKA